jgi:hypothetical protein
MWRIGKNTLSSIISANSGKLPARDFGEGAASSPLIPGEFIHIGILNSLDSNATAFRVGPDSYIGLNSGAILALMDMTWGLWADPDFMPWIGSPRIAADVQARSEFPKYPSGTTYLRSLYGRTEVGDEGAKEHLARIERQALSLPAERQQAAVLCHAFGTRFLWAHEIGHVVLGHLKHLEEHSEAGRSAIEEVALDGLAGKSENWMRHYFEFEADQFSYSVLLQPLVEQVKIYLSRGRTVPRLPGSPNLTHWDSITFAVLGCLFVKAMFHTAATLAGQETSASHPAVGDRFGACVELLVGLWDEQDEHYQQFGETVFRGILSFGGSHPDHWTWVNRNRILYDSYKIRLKMNAELLFSRGLLPPNYEARRRVEAGLPLG